MNSRAFGRLGTVSALSLGGGGIGGVWGPTDRAEATATVHAAIDAGITMLDLAPSYGDHEAETVTGAALRARPAPDVMITSKIGLTADHDDTPDLTVQITHSLHASLDRLGRDHLDLFLLHSQLRATDAAPVQHALGWNRYLDEVIPTFERLHQEGTIRAWGLTGIGHPQIVIDALHNHPRPHAVQVIVNALDLTGDLWFFGTDEHPRNPDVLRTAIDTDIPAIAIRALAAGSLGTTLDRPIAPDHPTAVDFTRAAPFRKLAAELGETPAALAHRYSLSVPGVATVVLGVKNRTELAECLAAEERGPLSQEELHALLELRTGPTR